MNRNKVEIITFMLIVALTTLFCIFSLSAFFSFKEKTRNYELAQQIPVQPQAKFTKLLESEKNCVIYINDSAYNLKQYAKVSKSIGNTNLYLYKIAGDRYNFYETINISFSKNQFNDFIKLYQNCAN